MDVPQIASAVMSEKTHLRLPTRPDWIEAAVEYARTKAIQAGVCQESRAGKLVVALHEALTNAVIHGNLELSSELKEREDSSFAEAMYQRLSDPVLAARMVDMVIDYDGTHCHWIITDEGPGFNVERALARAESDDPEIILSSGRGIMIMRSFLDDVRYELGGRRVVLTMTQASGQEKRQKQRRNYCQPLQVVPMREDGSVDWTAAYEALAQNISAGGMNLLQDRLTPATRILIGLPAGTEILYVPAEVRHVQSLAGNVVEIGCRFQTVAEKLPSQIEEVHKALETLLHTLEWPHVVPDERRIHVRLPFHEKIEVRREGSAPMAGFGRNLSKGGVSFWTTGAISLEEATILLPQGKSPPLGLSARICRCIKVKDGLYDVSAIFLGLENVKKKRDADG